MKTITKLPGILRRLFGFLRIATVLLAVFWLLALIYNIWIQTRNGPGARFIAEVGQISLPGAPSTVGLGSDAATAGTLMLHSLRGNLQVDLGNADAALVSAVRQTIIPAMTALIIFSYVVFAALRRLCGNLERGEVFNDENLCLVRRIGVMLIAYSLFGVALELWAAHALGGYFGAHVVLTGLKADLPFAPGAMQFMLPSGLLTNPGGLIIGCLVLVVAEAFRQGLKLKTENDLTV